MSESFNASLKAVIAITKQLEVAEEAGLELNAQKDENLKLKETIDRMRYEMDQLRTSQTRELKEQPSRNDMGSLSAPPPRASSTQANTGWEQYWVVGKLMYFAAGGKQTAALGERFR